MYGYLRAMPLLWNVLLRKSTVKSVEKVNRDGTKEKPGKQIMSEMNTVITKAATVQGKSDSLKIGLLCASQLIKFRSPEIRHYQSNQHESGKSWDLDD